MPLALFVLICCDVASLRLVLVVRPLFMGIRCFILCICFWSYTGRGVLPRGRGVMFCLVRVLGGWLVSFPPGDLLVWGTSVSFS